MRRSATMLLLGWLLACTPDAAPVDGGTSSSSGTVADAGAQDAGLPEDFGPPGAEADDDACSNGLDDDNNGFADCDDFWCRDSVVATVCSSLENSAAACSDGVDNSETPGSPNNPRTDGLVDCADPDCAKNPRLTGVCPSLRFELGTAACGDGADNDEDGLTDCADLDCLHAGSSSCAPRKRVLFDDAHRERAGSADWVVDVWGPHPWPTVPANERAWAGSLSSFGKDLVDTGRFTVETLPPWEQLTHGDATRAQDLMHYDVLVLPEPSAPFSVEEADALLAFVRGGGGLLMVCDHFDSDRDGNGWDSVTAMNGVLEHLGGGALAANPLGFSVATTSYEESGNIQQRNNRAATTVADGAQSHPLLAGAHGTVDRIGMFRGGLFTIHGPPAQALMHALPLGTAGYEPGSPFVVVSELESGRVAAVGDSAILNDGTDSHGIASPDFDSWHSTVDDNAALFLNAVEWLAQ